MLHSYFVITINNSTNNNNYTNTTTNDYGQRLLLGGILFHKSKCASTGTCDTTENKDPCTLSTIKTVKKHT